MIGDCYVYVIASDATAPNCALLRKATPEWRVCKVGLSVNPWARLCELQTCNPYTLDLLEVFKFPQRKLAEEVEKESHKCLSENRLVREWFFGRPCEILYTIQTVTGYMAAQVWDWTREQYRGLCEYNGYELDIINDLVAMEYGAEDAA